LRKNIFFKYMSRTVLVLVLSFTLLGFSLTAIVSGYFSDEKQKLLNENASSIALMTADLAKVNDMVIDPRMQSMMGTLGRSIGADIFLVNNLGETLYCSCIETPCIHKTNKVPLDILHIVKGGKYSSKGTLGGIYDANQYIVGLPIMLDDVTVIGAVFAIAPTSDFDSFRADIINMFLIAIVLAGVLSFVVMFFLNYRMVRPLRMMASAAKAFGTGDFSQRVPVTSDDEIGQLSAAFNSMAVSLSSLEGMRRSFVANVSHELRTPMTTISGFIDGILDGTIDNDKREYYLKLVSDEVKRLSRLVKSMLDMSRIDNNQIELRYESFDIIEVIYQILISFEAKIEEKHIEIRGLDMLTKTEMYADSDLMHQIVYNLIENAVKFTQDGGVIELDVFEKDDFVNVSVKNSGLGIKAEELVHIFDKFYKTDQSRNMDKKGVGLGLFIVKTVIALHKGDITVRSVEDEFCEFSFKIPKPHQGRADKNL